MGFVISQLHFTETDTILPGLAFAVGNGDYHTQAYALILLITTIVFVFFVIPKVAAGDGPWLRNLLVAAFFFKVSLGLFRLYWVWVEKGGADSRLYFSTGSRNAPSIWQLDFSFVSGLANPGTDFNELYASFVMALTGPTLPGIFLVYAMFSFAAAILYFKAFGMVFPNGNRKLFAGLIFFFPSWVYWPSSLGKDAPMALFIALVAYGLALIVARRNMGGLVLIALGIVAAGTIRPHLVGILGLAMALPIIMRLPTGSKAAAPALRFLYIAAVSVLALVLINVAVGKFNIEVKSLASIGNSFQLYEGLSSRAERGGSSFRPVPLTEPLGVPMAFITMLFRPFPWEAPNAAARVLSIEAVFFFGIVIWRLGAIRRAVKSMFSNPYVVFLVLYFIAWALALTVVGNFSLLARQRLMVLPAFFMLLSFPTAAEEIKNAGSSLARITARYRPQHASIASFGRNNN